MIRRDPTLNKKVALFLALLAGLFFVSLSLINRQFAIENNADFPFEFNIASIPLIIGLFAFARHRTSNSNHYLFLSAGFFVASYFDFLNLIFFAFHSIGIKGLQTPSIQSSTLYFSRFLLSIFILLSWLTWYFERKYGIVAKTRATITYLFALIISIGFTILIIFDVFPTLFIQGAFVGRPAEIITGVIFLLGLIGYLSEKTWSRSHLESWLIASLLISFVGQVLFAPFSHSQFDQIFLFSTITKIISYILVLVGIFLDIYQLYYRVYKQKEELQKQTNELKMFQLAVENASDQIIITDTNGIILYANPSTEVVTGFKIREIIGHNPSMWGGNMTEEFYKKMWNTLLVDKKTFVGEFQNVTKDKKDFIASLHIAPILDENGNVNYIVGISRDITSEKEIDIAKSEFIALASHQLLSPLSVINWHVELLKEQELGPLNKDQTEVIDSIERTNKRMVRLVKELISTFKVEMGVFDYEPVILNFGEVVKNVLEDYKTQIMNANVKIINNIPHNVSVLFDPVLLPIVITNLVSNAVKYAKKTDGEVMISIQETSEKTLLFVKDNGMGIPESQQDKIFTKFFRAQNAKKETVQGSGLGLYIAKSILDRADATINFTSEEGKGTTFAVAFKKL